MKSFLPIIFLLGISRNVLGKGIRIEGSNIEDELSYQVLINMNVSCYPSDSCTEDRTDESPVPAFRGKCSCHTQCWEYGTCCIDSPYRFKPSIQKCDYIGGKTYYMVHRCPDNTHPDSIWRSHCERESNERDDISMISPVTSLDTSRTYKNYYCFRCHETTDNYVSWDLDVTAFSPKEASVYSVAYNQTEKAWVAILDESHVSIPVILDFLFPDNVQAEPLTCDYFSDFQDCPESADERLRAKCSSYYAVIYSGFTKYKNVHCALCENQSLDRLTCTAGRERPATAGPERPATAGPERPATAGPERPAVIPLFSNFFSCVIDINGGGKDKKCFKKEDKPETCKGDYEVWNSYTKKCEKPRCPEAGYVLKNDICVKP